MTTVARRTFASTPQRDALGTWQAIVALLTQGRQANRAELDAVAGIAAAIITDHAVRDASITVTCNGPRTRIYCLYDDDALDSSDANEDPLGYDPLNGDWAISLPCLASDLDWVQASLAARSSRITARDSTADASVAAANKADAFTLTIDEEGFLSP